MKRLIIILLSFISISLSSAQNKRSAVDSILFEKINEYREENCLNRLTWCDSAYKTSLHHTRYLANNHKISHDRPDEDFLVRFEMFGIDSYYQGENLMYVNYYNTPTDDSLAVFILEGWKNSPTHNELLLEPIILKGAIGHAGTGKFSHYTMTEYGDIYFMTEFKNYYWFTLEVYN